jgi:type I restriction enzyme S subunit
MMQFQRLDTVVEITMGQAPDGESYNLDRQGLPLIAGAGDFGETRPNPKKYTTTPGKTCQAGDVILGIRATIGEKVLADGIYCLGRGVAGLRPKAGLDVRYLWQWLSLAAPVLASKAKGATFKQVTREDIGELRIPLPPLPEQRRIAAILDKADELRAKRRAALKKLDELTQSIFLDMFGDPATNPKGWPIFPLADLCCIAGEYGAGVASKPYDPELPRYIRITDITDSGDLTPDAVSPAGDASEWAAYSLEPGDVLFARSGATVGKTYLHRQSYGRSVFAGYLIRFRVRPDRILPEYLFHFTRTSAYRRWVAARQRVVAQPNINAQQYGQELYIPCPPLELQARFKDQLNHIDRVRTEYHTALIDTDALFASLQHRAFRGEL